MRSIVPGSSAEFVQALITQAQSNRTGAGLGAVLGFLVALWSACGYGGVVHEGVQRGL